MGIDWDTMTPAQAEALASGLYAAREEADYRDQQGTDAERCQTEHTQEGAER